MKSRAEVAESLFKEAKQLLDADKAFEAVEKARMACNILDNNTCGLFNLAGILIDAGGDCSNLENIKESVAILCSIEGRIPELHKGSYHYNLGSGYSEIGIREDSIGPAAKPSLSLAVSHFDEALQFGVNSEILTNLGRVFLAQGRYIEACDEFDRAIALEPMNHNAFALRGSSLMGIHNWTGDHRGFLIGALNDHEEALRLSEGNIPAKRSYTKVIDDLHSRGIRSSRLNQVMKTKEQKWIWTNRLGLNLCPVCQSESPKAFDLYPLAWILSGNESFSSFKEIVEIVNSICRSYATARWMLFSAIHSSADDLNQIITLRMSSNTQQNLCSGLMMASLSSFYSVLGQVAYGLNSVFKLGHDVKRVDFEKVWRPVGAGEKGVPKNQDELHQEFVNNECFALSALYGLALSMDVAKGRYRFLRDLRNRIEHHVIVPAIEVTDSRFYTSVKCFEIESAALQVGRIAKAAIWYFCGAIAHWGRKFLQQEKKKGKVIGNGTMRRVERI